MGQSSDYPPIGDYALIGDCHTAALIARDGSIDWLCADRFDAPAVFCRLLDARQGGFFKSAPTAEFEVERRYVGATNVLQTTFTTASGRLRVTDLMPVHRRSHHRRGYDVGSTRCVLRLLEGVAGDVDIDVTFKPTFDFARASTSLSVVSGRGVVAAAESSYLVLACPGAAFSVDDSGAAHGRLRVSADDRVWLALTCADTPDGATEALQPSQCDRKLQRTLDYWREWSDQCTYRGPYRGLVERSALVLKLLTYEPTGAVIAAPTTSLPEEIGGERNWDYRFTWLRDASLILYALMTLGYREEAADFIHWIEETVGSDPTNAPQIMYGIDGRSELPEHALAHLEGYRRSRPVRTGNAAAEQRQLDIYGEVLRAADMYYRHPVEKPEPAAWDVLRELVERAAKDWTVSGHGMWEVRGRARPFTYGKLMCWSALDVGIRLAQQHALEAPLERWQRERDRIRSTILERGVDQATGAFVQAFGTTNMDASMLIVPRIGFLRPTDPRVRATVERTRRELMQHGLVYRYRTEDGLAGGEGTFTLCSYWLADALALEGAVDSAHRLFEHVSSFANDLGLLSEEINPLSGEQLGNFPQGFSHLALVGAAVDLERAARHGAEHQAQRESDRAHTVDNQST